MFLCVSITEATDLGGQEATPELIQNHLQDRLGFEVTSIVALWGRGEGLNPPIKTPRGEGVIEYGFEPNCLIEVYMTLGGPDTTQLYLALVKEA